MQAAKDSFYMALRERLAALNPGRVIVVDGVERPGVIVRENLEVQSATMPAGAFLLDWGEVRVAEQTRPILGVDCQISYAEEGSSATGVDRGRRLAEMDEELLRICHPPHTAMRDYRQTPSVDLGCGVFWTMPELKNAAKEAREQDKRRGGAARLERRASLRVYFFLPEVGA